MMWRGLVFLVGIALVVAACVEPVAVNEAPTLTNPGNQTNTVGDTVNLSLSASDPENDALSFSATGLPDGLSIGTSGVISGSPTTEGTSTVEASVSDGSTTDSETFSWLVNPALPAEAPDFSVEIAGYLADDPTLIVGVSDLEVTDLEKLEYTLERFDSDCSDASTVATTAEVPLPSSAFTFDVPTTNYGAFKLSVTATYAATAFQNPVKTKLPPAFFPDSVNDPDALEGLDGLAFIELLDDFSVTENVKQAEVRTIKTGRVGETEDAFSFEVFVDLQTPDEATVEFVSYDLSGIGSGDRFWCDTVGIEFTVASGPTTLTGEEPNEAFNTPPPNSQPNTPFGFDIKPEPLIVDGSTRRLYTLYRVVVDEGFTTDDPDDVQFAPTQTFEFLVMDCESEEFPEGEDCGSFNDVTR